MIKERKEKNPNFEVFFIINKIDRAFEDNKKIEEIKNSSSKEEYFENVKKHWFYYEKIAIDILKKCDKRLKDFVEFKRKIRGRKK